MKLHWKLILGIAIICYAVTLIQYGIPYLYNVTSWTGTDWHLYLVDCIAGAAILSTSFWIAIGIGYLIPIKEGV